MTFAIGLLVGYVVGALSIILFMSMSGPDDY